MSQDSVVKASRRLGGDTDSGAVVASAAAPGERSIMRSFVQVVDF